LRGTGDESVLYTQGHFYNFTPQKL